MIGSFHIRRLGLVGGVLVLLAMPAAAQKAATPPPLEVVYVHADQMPRLPNGASDAAAIEAAIRQNLVFEPKLGRPLQSYDKGSVTFTIDPAGNVRNARVLTEVGRDFEQALLAATNKLPHFSPARKEGQAVALRYTVDVGAGAPYKYNLKPSGGIRLPPDWPDVEKWVPQPPRLPGGESLYLAVARRLVYPSAPAKPADKIPQVSVRFTVDVAGRITDALIDGSGGLAYDRAALRALAALRFEPGRRDGRPVPVHMEHTVSFSPLTPAAIAELKQASQKAATANYQTDDAHYMVTAPPAPRPPSDSTRVYTYVEQMPQLPGGGGNWAVVQEIQRFLKLPAEVTEGKIEGRVFASFVVGPHGSVYDVKIIKGLTASVDAAVLAAIGQLPRFVPGKQNGEAVSVAFTVPVSVWGPNHVFENAQLPTPATFPAPGLDAYIAKNLRVPAVVKKENLTGQVQVAFVVGADGQVRDAKVERPFCTSCDQEALRLVQAMPAWVPARNAQGQPVAVRLVQQVAMQGPQPAAAQPISGKPLNAGTNPSAVYTYVEQMPQLAGGGGNAAIMAAIRQNLEPAAATACAGSRVFIAITVAADGSVVNPTVVKGGRSACDEAALAAARKLARLQPGKQNGRPVAVSLTLPVVF